MVRLFLFAILGVFLGNIPPTMGGQAPMFVPQGPQPPMFVPQGPQPPMFVPQGTQAPMVVPQGPQAPMVVPQGPQAPMVVPQGPQAPMVVPQGPQAPMPTQRTPTIIKRKDAREATPQKKRARAIPNNKTTEKPSDKDVQDTREATPQKKGAIATTNNKTTERPSDKDIQDPKKPVADAAPPPPAELRPLTKKTIVIDARRLDGQRFTDTIRYIKDNPNVRLKLQNSTINPDDVVKIMKLLKDEGVIDQIRDIGFVMLPGGDQNLILNEKTFTEKVLPYLGHLEGVEFSCLGVSDKFLESLAKSLPHLKSISLFGVGITDKTVSNLAKTRLEITKLHLINTSVTSKCVPVLVKEFPYLKALGISGQHFKDVDYLALREGLAKVLSFSAVGQKFEKMKTVRDLLIAMPMLHTLDLSESTANDEVAKAIAEVGKKIQNLNISETQITFAGIQEIVNTRDLTKFKMNNLKAIGDKELQYIIEKQPGLKVFHFAGAYLTEATTMTLILKLPKLIDLTLIPAKESTWALTEGVEKALSLKKQKPQYLHIEARKLPEKLRLELEKDLPKLNLEYATAPAA